MKKSIVTFLIITAFSAGMIVYGCIFVDSTAGKATLTEETLIGDRGAANGLEVGFRADSGKELHWFNTYDYGSGETSSVFKRGEIPENSDEDVYDGMRFTGWSAEPYVTRLEYDRLAGLQEKPIHDFYDGLQDKVMESGTAEKGRIRVGDYIDYYPISFSFQLGTRTYDSSAALTGLKVYDERGILDGKKAASYDKDIDMYVAFNDVFRIPVIKNEYQEFIISRLDEYDKDISAGYSSSISRPLGEGEDMYEFDPIIVVQEENILDGMEWRHPDIAGDIGGDEAKSDGVRRASEYGLKNRLLFIVNNRTAKGEAVDVSQIRGGYGVFALPVDTSATATIGKSKRSWTLSAPTPLIDRLEMVYPLDAEAEFTAMSLSEDHRYLAVFSVSGGAYFVELVDADMWEPRGRFELFPASEKLTYAWGRDGSLAAANHDGYIAVLFRNEDRSGFYEVLYSGKSAGDFDRAFFNDSMEVRENSYTAYNSRNDRELAVTVKDGKAALVQNLRVAGGEYNIRNVALECAVVDESGVLYRGVLKSSLVDLGYNMSAEEMREIIMNSGGTTEEMMKSVIRPVGKENSAKWKL